MTKKQTPSITTERLTEIMYDLYAIHTELHVAFQGMPAEDVRYVLAAAAKKDIAGAAETIYQYACGAFKPYTS